MGELDATDLIIGLGIAFLIEGALYALWPQGMRRMMAMVLDQPPNALRIGGLSLAVIGLGLVWMVRG